MAEIVYGKWVSVDNKKEKVTVESCENGVVYYKGKNSSGYITIRMFKEKYTKVN